MNSATQYRSWILGSMTFCALPIIVLSALLLIAFQPAHGQTETVLYSFCAQPGCTDGERPLTSPVFDKNGNLYGTTCCGGAYGGLGYGGTVFKLTPLGIETILHSFGATGDGDSPYAGLVLDKEGNLYGTTFGGGTYGYGTVFKLTPSGTETILHSFENNGTDGEYPHAGLILDKEGNLYGTTSQGGTYGYGTVFMLTPSGTETILHSFDQNVGDGTYPYAGVILKGKGILYGTTHLGGTYGYGTVFKLTPSGTETILHSFDPNGKDGIYPYSGLVLGKNGHLYGTTAGGGAYGYGTVFKLTSSGTETILHSFGASGDGANIYDAPVLDKVGNLYGTTSYGGAHQEGTVFELMPSGTETLLWSFGNGTDGTYPNGLVFDGKGNLYGTTQYGGAYGTNCDGTGCGTVFKLTP